MSTQLGSLEESLDGMLELRPFPATASRLMTACNDLSITVRELAEIIKCDSGLSMKLLQIANSPLYGFSGEIRSIDHATVVLGMRAIRDLAVSTAVGEVFDSGDAATAQIRKNLWQHSLACGCVARMLAAHCRDVVPDEAFLGGVIHDVGKLFILDHDSVGYAQLSCDSNLQSLPPSEIEKYGLPHTVVGQRCAQDWGLPEEIVDVIGFHHEPEEADFGGPLVDLVYVANHLTSCWFDGREPETSHEEVLQRVNLEIDADALELVRQTSEKTIQEMSDVGA
jgi:putative nucleotidyltransferase with HDIG domain